MSAKVINLFGSPGAGKSTIALGLCYQLKKHGINAELANEWIKDKVFEEAPYPFTDELYVFAQQHKKLKQMVGKCDVIVSDSPILLPLIFAKDEPSPFEQLVVTYYHKYANINYYIEREHKYVETGRNENEEQSKILAEKLKNLLVEHQISYKIIGSLDAVDLILEDLISQGFLIGG